MYAFFTSNNIFVIMFSIFFHYCSLLLRMNNIVLFFIFEYNIVHSRAGAASAAATAPARPPVGQMQQGIDPSSSKETWMLTKANKLQATTTETTWAYIQVQVLPSSKDVCVEIRAFGCTMDTMQVSLAGCCLWRRRGAGRLPSYDQWSCP